MPCCDWRLTLEVCLDTQHTITLCLMKSGGSQCLVGSKLGQRNRSRRVQMSVCRTGYHGYASILVPIIIIIRLSGFLTPDMPKITSCAVT